ncbi:glycosyltransferase family 9 protein [candidate division KSB1 bacterium]
MKIGKTIERTGKGILSFLLKFILRTKEISTSNLYPEDIKNVIIIRQDRKIGNLILTTPLIKCCKTTFSNAKIDILLANNLKVLCENNPNIDNLYIFDHIGFIKNPLRFIKLILKLRKNRYYVALESSHPGGSSFLNGFITFLTGAVFRIGFNKGSGAVFTNVHIEPDESKHYYLMQQDLVNAVSGKEIIYEPEINVNENDKLLYRKTLEKEYNLNKSSKIIGVWIGARFNKRWDLSNFTALCETLFSAKDYFPLLALGIEEEKLFNSIDRSKYNVLQFDDLKKLSIFISACDSFICGDTGPLHLSRALRIPTIGIFLQDNYTTYGYSNEKTNFIIKPGNTAKMLEEINYAIKKIFEVN